MTTQTDQEQPFADDESDRTQVRRSTNLPTGVDFNQRESGNITGHVSVTVVNPPSRPDTKSTQGGTARVQIFSNKRGLEGQADAPVIQSSLATPLQQAQQLVSASSRSALDEIVDAVDSAPPKALEQTASTNLPVPLESR